MISIGVGLFVGCLAFASNSFDLSDNFYLPKDDFDKVVFPFSSSWDDEELMPSRIENENDLIVMLGESYILDTGINDGYPILYWEK